MFVPAGLSVCAVSFFVFEGVVVVDADGLTVAVVGASGLEALVPAAPVVVRIGLLPAGGSDVAVAWVLIWPLEPSAFSFQGKHYCCSGEAKCYYSGETKAFLP